MADYKLKNVCDFDLAQTLECGQCFHFVKLDELEIPPLTVGSACL